jgi:outer membrane lipoprotein-sorting protein
MFIFARPVVSSSFALRGNQNFISFDDFIGLYQKFIRFSYKGNKGAGFCKAITLSDDPELVIYSVEHEKKFRAWMLRDFDFIELVEI